MYATQEALNAVAKCQTRKVHLTDAWYFELAAADNGLALGCAFTAGWNTFNQPKAARWFDLFWKEYSKKLSNWPE